jgi:signal peptidase I
MTSRPWFVAAAGVVATTFVLYRLHRLRRQFLVIRVTGVSMLPNFRPGERVIVRRGRADQLAVGAVVVMRAPDGIPPPRAPWAKTGRGGSHWVIKRVAALPGDRVPDLVRAAAPGASIVPQGKLALLSDNPAGTDSRHWGLVPAGDLLGFVIARLPPDARHPMLAGSLPTPE